jgi:ABC-2 type transport system permease protein
MTTLNTEQSRTVPTAEPRARFGDLIAAEWLKLWSLRSTAWALAISALAIIAFNVGTAYDHYKYWYEQDARAKADFIPHGYALLDAFTTNAGLVLVLAASAIGAIAITGEYSTGLIRTTFAAVPARRSVMAAKVSVVAAVMTLFGAVVAAASFFLSQAILSGRHAGVSIGYPGALRIVVASALLAPVSALVGVALGALIRHSAAAVVGCVVILLLSPIVVTDGRRWAAVIDHTLPFSAWMRPVDISYTGTGPYPRPAYPWTVTGGWIVYAAWALAAAALAVTVVHHRDQ